MEAHAGEYIRNYLHVKRFPRISLVCKLVPVQYREYEYGLWYCFLPSVDNDGPVCIEEDLPLTQML